ncbi:hypothetical protein BH10PLA2_BH10PLA2_08270 [soil metagenome]
MEKLVLDEAMRSKLGGLSKQIEFCDEMGRSLGHFLPATLHADEFYIALARESPHSPEELRRRHQEEGGRSLKEIWRDLGRAS